MGVPKIVYKQIVRKFAEKNCVLFLGAGASYVGEGRNSLPLGKQLSKDLARSCRLGSPRGKRLSEIATYFEIVGGKGELENFVIERIKKVTKPLELHRQVLRLPFKIIVTTNYDVLLEKSFEQEGREEDYCCIYYKDDSLRDWDEQKIIIIKLHGDIKCLRGYPKDHPPNRPLIITDHDYINFLATPYLIKDFLRYLLATKTFIFIGYSLSDYNVRLVLEQINTAFSYSSGDYERFHYSIQKGAVRNEEFSYWKKRGILIYKEDGTKFLRRLADDFSKVSVKDIMGNSLEEPIERFRFEMVDFVEKKTIDLLIRDIKEKSFQDIYSEYGGDISEIFLKTSNQKQLIDLIREGDHKPLSVVLEILGALSITICKDVLEAIYELDYDSFSYKVIHQLLYCLSKPEAIVDIPEHVVKFIRDQSELNDPDIPYDIPHRARELLSLIERQARSQ